LLDLSIEPHSLKVGYLVEFSGSVDVFRDFGFGLFESGLLFCETNYEIRAEIEESR
jgi:hypothetical protein